MGDGRDGGTNGDGGRRPRKRSGETVHHEARKEGVSADPVRGGYIDQPKGGTNNGTAPRTETLEEIQARRRARLEHASRKTGTPPPAADATATATASSPPPSPSQVAADAVIGRVGQTVPSPERRPPGSVDLVNTPDNPNPPDYIGREPRRGTAAEVPAGRPPVDPNEPWLGQAVSWAFRIATADKTQKVLMAAGGALMLDGVQSRVTRISMLRALGRRLGDTAGLAGDLYNRAAGAAADRGAPDFRAGHYPIDTSRDAGVPGDLRNRALSLAGDSRGTYPVSAREADLDALIPATANGEMTQLRTTLNGLDIRVADNMQAQRALRNLREICTHEGFTKFLNEQIELAEKDKRMNDRERLKEIRAKYESGSPEAQLELRLRTAQAGVEHYNKKMDAEFAKHVKGTKVLAGATTAIFLAGLAASHWAYLSDERAADPEPPARPTVSERR